LSTEVSTRYGNRKEKSARFYLRNKEAVIATVEKKEPNYAEKASLDKQAAGKKYIFLMSRFILFSYLVVMVFAVSCREKAKPISVISENKLHFGNTDSIAPPEKIDTSELKEVYQQNEFGKNGGGQITLQKNGLVNLAYWSAIHHQLFMGTWQCKNDTLEFHFTKLHESGNAPGNPDLDARWKFIKIYNQLYQVWKDERDNEPYLPVEN
jgi:hypothetical protein